MNEARRRILLAAAGAAVHGLAPRTLRAELRRVTIGANPAGTNFNVIAGGFAKVIQQKLGIASIVRPYSGSSVYLPMLQRGEITLGINSGIDSYLAYNGDAPYPAPMQNLRALMAQASMVIHLEDAGCGRTARSGSSTTCAAAAWC